MTLHSERVSKSALHDVHVILNRAEGSIVQAEPLSVVDYVGGILRLRSQARSAQDDIAPRAREQIGPPRGACHPERSRRIHRTGGATVGCRLRRTDPSTSLAGSLRSG